MPTSGAANTIALASLRRSGATQFIAIANMVGVRFRIPVPEALLTLGELTLCAIALG